jgi:hypothetical protein
MDRNRWADLGDLNPCSFRSRRRTGTCGLSSRYKAAMKPDTTLSIGPISTLSGSIA